MKGKLMNPVLDFINTLCNFIALNIVFLITCLPVVTIGTALSSLYCVTLREARGEYGYLVRTYLQEFKANLKSGTLAFLILLAAGAVLLFNLVFWNAMGDLFSMVIAALILVACIAFFLIFTYTFPLLARFENSTLQTFKNAFSLAVANKKATLFLILIDTLFVFFCIFLPPAKLMMVLFGFAFLAYSQSFVFKEVFKPFEPSLSGMDDGCK